MRVRVREAHTALRRHRDHLLQEVVELRAAHILLRHVTHDEPVHHLRARPRHEAVLPAQPHVPPPLDTVGMDHGLVAAYVAVAQVERLEHARVDAHQPLVGVGVGVGVEVRVKIRGSVRALCACWSVCSPNEAETGSLQACSTCSCTMRKRLSGSEQVSLIMHAWLGLGVGWGEG